MAKVEPNTLAGLRRVFNKPDLDVNKFISNISKNGGAEIFQTLTDLSRMTDEASCQMKKAIFNNFKLFIDASKAVTILSTMMHQLDNQLVEQMRLCSALAEKSLFRDEKKISSDTGHSSNVSSRVSSLLSSVDGVSNLVRDSTRQLLFDTDAIEVNPTTYSKQGYVHLFVLSDYILVAKKQYNSYEMCRYKKQALYEIENVVVVDVKATDAKVIPLNLVQLLVFPDCRVFQTDSIKSKRALISTIDEVKRLHLIGAPVDEAEEKAAETSGPNSEDSNSIQGHPALVVGADATPEVDTLCFEALAGIIPEIADLIRPDRPSTGVYATTRVNPFHKDSFNMIAPPTSLSEDGWLWETPEDVDVAVAVRDFAKAARLIARARRRLAQLIPSDSTQQQQQSHASAAAIGLIKLRDRVESRATNLSAALQEELTRGADRYGASQSVFSAAVHLSELGKTVLALHLFLSYRSGVIGTSLIRGVRQEGNQLVYLNRLSFMFHRGLIESVTEWNQLIDQLRKQPDFLGLDDVVTSKLCSWVLEETVRFCKQLKVILIDSRSISFYAMACASERIHAHAKKATELIGVDVKSIVDNCLFQSWQRAVEEQERVYRDAVELRASWKRFQGVNQSMPLMTLFLPPLIQEEGSLQLTSGDHFESQPSRPYLASSSDPARRLDAPLTKDPSPSPFSMRQGELFGLTVAALTSFYLFMTLALPLQNRADVKKETWLLSGSSDMNTKTVVEAGFPEAKQSLNGRFVKTGGRGGLSDFSTQSTRSLCHFAHACARFDCAELLESCATTLANMLRKDLEVYSRALAATKTPEENKPILVNLHFFTSKVIPKIATIMNCAEQPVVMAVVKDFKKVLRGSQK